MNYSDKIQSVRQSGHGHYKVTISYYGKDYTATVNDMTLIDSWKDSNAAAGRLFRNVKRLAL